MKRNSLTNVAKRVMAGCLAVAMVLTGIVLMPKDAKATDTPATEVFYDDDAKEYKISDYWTTDSKKAPVKAGFVFGGWYVTENGERVPLKEDDLKNAQAINGYDATAYAKFVPAGVLSIKTQKGTDGTTTSLRILSTVDSKNYQAVGFRFKLATQSEGKTADITKVYSKIRESKGSETTYEPDIFVSGVSKYFMAADVSSIASTSFAKIVYARPYWITMDGTKVLGLARNSRVEDKDNNYTSVGINLLPIETVKVEDANAAQVAVGKIRVKYNNEYYDVKSVDITADNSTDGVGGKYLFDKMEYHVNEDAGTITFVGNVEDLDVNKLADGLYANVRFAKTSINTDNTALTLEVTTTDFCNWAEADVTAFVVQ